MNSEIVISLEADESTGKHFAKMKLSDGTEYESPYCDTEEQAQVWANKMIEIVKQTMDVKAIHWPN